MGRPKTGGGSRKAVRWHNGAGESKMGVGVSKMDASGLKMGVGVEMGGIGCRNRVGVVEWVTRHAKAGGCCGAEHG